MGDAGGIRNGRRPRSAVTLDGLAVFADLVTAVRRHDLDPGDRLIVATRNSVYSLTANADGSFDARGGWFERQRSNATRVEIRGCDVGGHAIFTDHVAAPGMFLEFDNGLRTTRIRSVRRIPAGAADGAR